MASRSTRRSIKNSEIPKIDKCQTDEDSPEKTEVEGGRRRSLRHSPGSSTVSPPRKIRKIKGSPDIIDDNVHKSQTSQSKYNKLINKSPSKANLDTIDREDENEELENTIPVTPKRNTRNSSFPLSPRSSRSSSISPCNLVPKISAVDALRNLSVVDVEDTPVSNRRSTRKKTNSIIETKSDVDITRCNSSKLDSNVQSTSTSIQCLSKKRSLQGSSEDTLSTNGSLNQSLSLLAKRKCVAVTSSNEDKPSSYGKQCEESKVNDKSEISGETNSSSHLNGKLLKACSSDAEETCESSSTPLKRRFSLSPENGTSRSNATSKKSKVEASPPVDCTETNALIEKLKDISFAKQESNICHLDDRNKFSNSEVLLKEFGLTEEQLIEICSLMPIEVRDSSYIEIVEKLVTKMLYESISLKSLSTPRFNKLLRQLLIKYCGLDASVEKKHQLCENAHTWSKERKTVNLRHELELALMTLYYNTGFYRKAEETASGLYKETKKLQDKEKNVKACLCLSKAYHAMGNISTARANITTAKTEALKIYTPPDLQAELDLQSGIMQVAEEKDMETAFSYFKEAATGFLERKNRSRALKYMLLTKLLVDRPEEGEKVVKSPCHIDDIDTGVEAMLHITKAAVASSLADFKAARIKYEEELDEDLVVKSVLDQLYHKMLEKNLLNIISPYERMQISVVADKIGLNRDEVEKRLSQMILDGEVKAQLDHRDDCLYIYQPEEEDSVYKDTLSSISQVDKTLSLLNRKVKQLL